MFLKNSHKNKTKSRNECYGVGVHIYLQMCMCLLLIEGEAKISFNKIYFFILKIFIGVQLIHNVVLVSGIQQSESFIHIHISTLF